MRKGIPCDTHQAGTCSDGSGGAAETAPGKSKPEEMLAVGSGNCTHRRRSGSGNMVVERDGNAVRPTLSRCRHGISGKRVSCFKKGSGNIAAAFGKNEIDGIRESRLVVSNGTRILQEIWRTSVA